MNYVGDYSAGDTVMIYFNTFDSNDPSASVTMTNFINTDVHIHKNDSLTQRNNAAGITVDVDVDGIAGCHLIKIDTSDNTVADFYVAGADYGVRIEGVTVDAATLNPFVGHFSIENRHVAGSLVKTTIATLASQTSFTLTAGSADDNAYNNCTAIITDIASAVQKAVGIISDYTGATKTVTLAADPGIFTMAANDRIHIFATSALANVYSVGGTAQTANDMSGDVNAILLDTAEIGAAGAGLTDLGGMSTGMKGEVNAEADTALSDYDPPTKAEMDTAHALLSTAAALTTHDGKLDTVDANVDLIVARQTLLSGTASAGSSTTITLTGGVATDEYYSGQLVVITGGTGAGQARTVLSYVGSTTVATVTRDFAVAPTSDSVFAVLSGDIPAILEAGTATAGAAATITLDAGASAIDDTYKNNYLMITAGTGIGQTRLIGAYNGTSKVATVLPNWTTNPASGSVYQILPGARVDVGGWLGNVVTGDGDWAALKAETAAILVDTGTTLDGAISTIDGNVDAILVDTGTTLQGELDAIQAAVITNAAGADIAADIIAVKAETASILTDTGTTLDGKIDTIDTNVDAVLVDTGTTLDGKINTIDTNVDSILSDTGTDGVLLATDAVSAAALKADAVDEILDEVIEGTTTMRHALKIMLAALAGKSAGGGTATITFRDVGDAKDRITATVDANGNRTAITLDGA